MSNEHELLD
jgi:2-polyprenyl-6-methoxyphenol hydroxylase-like FAD-dependent oxidoreductase